MNERKTLTPRAFFVRLVGFSLAVLLIAGGVMYMVDPYEHYRKSSTDYVINDRFCMPGLIEQETYNAVLIGSSMCQNFDMDLMEETLGGEILKAVKGGMTPGESALLCDLIAQNSKADTIYLGLDLSRFNETGEAEEYYPAYLTDESVFNDARYLFGYEAWMRYLPLDLAVLVAECAGVSLPQAIENERDADAIGRWAERAEAQNAYVGEDKLVENYLTGRGSVGAQNPEGMVSRMRSKLDEWLAGDPFSDDITYYVFFSPYSALYWAHTAREGTFEGLLEFRAYFFEKLREFDNVIPVDFQAMEETRDLSLYKDISHYHQSVNDKMTHGLASGEYVATAEAVEAHNDYLRESVAQLVSRHPELAA